jgi:5'-nucleotidase
VRILVSNDDGILARGLALLADVCRTVGEVTVVAPDREQSGTSHSLTLTRPLRPVRRPDGAYQVDGTPTDCVLLALGTLLAERPEYVFSGINHGPNMGEDVLYSGTVAAAMEGLSLGIPGVAISFAGGDLDLLETHRAWLERLIAGIVRVKDFPPETLLNVNLPPVPGDEIHGIKVTTLGSRAFSESLMETRDPWGRRMYWIGGGQISWSGSEDSDFIAVRDGFISVTPLHVDLTNYTLLEAVRQWNLGA